MIPKLTAIGSGKGGTGKTLIATALATTLSRLGERILLCDADFGLSNTTLQLGLSSGGDLAGFLSGCLRLDEAAVRVVDENDGGGDFDLLAALPGSGDLIDFDARSAQRLVSQLRNSRGYDRILIDLGAGLGSATTTIAAHADEALLVLTNDPAALTDAYAFVKVLLRLNSANVKFVVNMVENGGEAQRTAEAFVSTCRTFLRLAPSSLGSIPRDAHAAAAIRLQQPLVTAYPQSQSAKAVVLLAQQIHGVVAPRRGLSLVHAER